MRADLNSQLGAEDLNIWHYSSSNTLFEHAVLTRRLFTSDQTLLLQTACLTQNSNMAFPNSVFGFLSNKINGWNLPSQGFWEISVSNILDILLSCTQISVCLIGYADACALVATLNLKGF